jgi:hypothetical protein
MPRVSQSSRDREVQMALARIADFESPAAWRRSAKGNLWREWEDKTVTIFQRKGLFHWCVADGEETRYSREEYETEDDARMALCEFLGVVG